MSFERSRSPSARGARENSLRNEAQRSPRIVADGRAARSGGAPPAINASRWLRWLTLLVVATVAAACATPPASSTQSPTPDNGGTATLSETSCDFQIPDRVALHSVAFNLVNRTKYVGRFIFARLDDPHTFAELLEDWNGPLGKVNRPDYVNELGFVELPANTSGLMHVTIRLAGTYAFSCGYSDEIGTVTGFWHGPIYARAT